MGAQDTVLRETGRILRDCVFITSFLAWHAECCCSMRRDAHQLPCLYRFPRPTTWFGCSNSVAVRCWCWCWLRAGQKEKRGGKVDSTFIMSALRLEGWPEPGREGLERESQRLRAPAACRGRATTTHAADSLRRHNGDKSWALPMASERSGRSGIGCPVALSGQGSVVWTKIQTTCQHHLDLCRLTSCTTRVPLSCLTDGQATKSTRPKTCHLKVSLINHVLTLVRGRPF